MGGRLMTKRSASGNLMRADELTPTPGPSHVKGSASSHVEGPAPSAVEGPAQPQTRNELQSWVREHLALTPDREASLLTAIDAVFTRHERLWQESKQDAITALSAGFAEKMAHVASE